MTTLAHGFPTPESNLRLIRQLQDAVALLSNAPSLPPAVQALLNFFTPQGSDMALAGQLIKSFAGPLDKFSRGTTSERTGQDGSVPAERLIPNPELIVNGHLFYDTTLNKMFQFKHTSDGTPANRLNAGNWIGVGDPELHHVDDFIASQSNPDYTRINNITIATTGGGTIANPSITEIQQNVGESYTRFLLEAFLRNNLSVEALTFPRMITPYTSLITLPGRYAFKGAEKSDPLPFSPPAVTNVVWADVANVANPPTHQYSVVHRRISIGPQAVLAEWDMPVIGFSKSTAPYTTYTDRPPNDANTEFDTTHDTSTQLYTDPSAYPIEVITQGPISSDVKFGQYVMPPITTFASTDVGLGGVYTTFNNLTGTGDLYMSNRNTGPRTNGTTTFDDGTPVDATPFPTAISRRANLVATNHAVVPILKVVIPDNWRYADSATEQHPGLPQLDYSLYITGDAQNPVPFGGAGNPNLPGPGGIGGSATVSVVTFATTGTGNNRIHNGHASGATLATRKFMIEAQAKFMLWVPKLGGKWPTVYRAIASSDQSNGWIGVPEISVYRRYPIGGAGGYVKGAFLGDTTPHVWNGVDYAVYDFNRDQNGSQLYKYMFFYEYDDQTKVADGVTHAGSEIANFMAINAPGPALDTNWG